MSAPSWMYPATRAVAETAVKDIESPVVTSAPIQMSETFTAEEKTALSKVHWILRITYMINAILLAACAAVAIQSSNSIANITKGSSTESWGVTFLSFYVFVFSILICCFEIGLTVITKCMSENFGFLYTVIGRFTFMSLLCGILVKLYLFGQLMIAVIGISLLLHTVLLCRNPRLGEYIRQLHYYAGQ